MEHHTVTVHDIPDHIMVEIFSYLTLQQLKQAGFTCRSWFDLIHQTCFPKKHVVVQYGELAPEELLLSISKPSLDFILKMMHPSPNLLFSYFNVNYKSQKELWLLRGKVITSLTFKDCRIRSRDLSNILRSSPNLQQLDFDKCDLWNVRPIFESSGVINLKCLCFDGDCKFFVSDEFLDSVSTIAVGLKKLSFCGMPLREFSGSDVKRPSFEGFFRFVTHVAPTLSELDLRRTFLEDDQWCSIFAVESLKLKCLRLTLNYQYSQSNDVLLSLVRSQGANLKELDIDLTTAENEIVDTEVFYNIHGLCLLEVLKIKATLPNEFWISVITDLLIGGLQMLKRLNFENHFENPFQSSIEFSYDFGLRIRPIVFPRNEFFNFFGGASSFILELKLDNVSLGNSLMKNICRFLPDLVVLSLKNVSFTDVGLTSCRCAYARTKLCRKSNPATSIMNLRRLKTLELENILNIFNHCFGAFQFQYLTNLTLNRLPNITVDIFPAIGDQNRCLEVVTLKDIPGFSDETLTALLQSCPNLTTLVLTGLNKDIKACDVAAQVKQFGPNVLSVSISHKDNSEESKAEENVARLDEFE